MTSPPIRVETVSVGHGGRRPIVVAGLLVALVTVSIIKPWTGPDPAQPGPTPASSMPAAVAVPAAPSSAPGRAESAQTAAAFRAAPPVPLAPGQVRCGSAEWRIVTLGDVARWTVRTSIVIAPVEADGPGDTSIPDLALGDSDVAGLGACAPSGGIGAPGRASRIVAAWRVGTDQAAATFGRVVLADLDPLPSGGPAGEAGSVSRRRSARPTHRCGARWALAGGSIRPAPGLPRRAVGPLDRHRDRRYRQLTPRPGAGRRGQPVDLSTIRAIASSSGS